MLVFPASLCHNTAPVIVEEIAGRRHIERYFAVLETDASMLFSL